MEKPEIVVGLDIGTTKICAIIGCRTETGKLEILGMGKAESAGVMRGVVTNIDKTVNGILEASQVAGDKANVDIRVVSVGIAGQHIRSLQHRGILTRNNTNTEISKEDIERLIQDKIGRASCRERVCQYV